MEDKLTKNESALLNYIRVFAIILLLVGHGISIFQHNIFKPFTFPNIVYIQNISVVLLMILSGFLTHFSLSRKKRQGNYSFYDYLLNRSKRFFPELIISLIIITMLDLLMIRFSDHYGYLESFNLRTLLGNTFFLQGFPNFGFEPFGSSRPLWTLSIEWWLYLSVAWVYLGKREKLITPVGLFVLFVLSYFPVTNFLAILKGYQRSIVIYWVLGWLSYSLYKVMKKVDINNSLLILINLLGFVLIVYRLNQTKQAYDLVLAVILTLQLLFSLYASNKITFSSKIFKLGTMLSEYTYSAYLIHYSIMLLVHYLFNNSDSPNMLLLSLLISIVISFFITKMANVYRLKSK